MVTVPSIAESNVVRTHIFLHMLEGVIYLFPKSIDIEIITKSLFPGSHSFIEHDLMELPEFIKAYAMGLDIAIPFLIDYR